jgi:hypothetical protein
MPISALPEVTTVAQSDHPIHVRPDVEALIRAVGLEALLSQPSNLPQVERFHAGAARLRDLDLSQVEPVLVYRPKGGER